MNRLRKADELAVAVGIGCLVLGWFLGVWACWSFKPYRTYMVERTVYVVSDWHDKIRVIGSEDTFKYFVDGKEVTCERSILNEDSGLGFTVYR